MADRMSTRIRYDRIRDNGAISRTRNGHLKRKERNSRDERMTNLIKSGKFPYTPPRFKAGSAPNSAFHSAR